VHFASISHPIVGDQTYGIDKINAEFEEKYWLTRQWLHARRLSFELFAKKYAFVGKLKEDHKSILSPELLQLLENGK
jgi:23S rRNA-/tRNA-specific pseudouridylate synthase